jgi:hypothetical protein
VSGLSAGSYGSCYRSGAETTYALLSEDPDPGEAWFYIVTGETPDGEGSRGTDSFHRPRPQLPRCP